MARLAAVTARFVYLLRAPTSLLFRGYRGVKLPGCGADPSLPFSADVKNVWS